jgi:hypothetical protein
MKFFKFKDKYYGLNDLSEEDCKFLYDNAEESTYGLEGERILDKSVRDSREIVSSIRSVFDIGYFSCHYKALTKGYHDGAIYDNSFLKLIIYPPGGHFGKHSDGNYEKRERYGTAVVTLPTKYSGGELEIYGDNLSATYQVGEKKIKYYAFKKEIEHEVKPVKSGYRVVMVYELLEKKLDTYNLARQIYRDRTYASTENSSFRIVSGMGGSNDSYRRSRERIRNRNRESNSNGERLRD